MYKLAAKEISDLAEALTFNFSNGDKTFFTPVFQLSRLFLPFMGCLNVGKYMLFLELVTGNSI